MFVLSIKNPLKGKKKIFVIALLIACVAAIFIGVIRTSHNYAQNSSVGKFSVKVSNNQELDAFLQKFSLSGTPSKKEEIKVPTYFNKTYKEYNSLQKQIGLDLNNYRGRTAEKYTVTDSKNSRNITLLIYNCRV
ncbi:MAG: DUF4830 domain-containing protein, partial [Acutalibacteraceae bacterium]